MKVSVCITTLNEVKNIQLLIKSLLKQTRKPDEIIIIDGGSTDGTVQEIRKFKSIKLIVSKKVSIAEGRNIAIKKAKYGIIVMTDAGCTCNRNWLKEILKPFSSKNTDVVAGFYKMTGKSNFQKALMPFLGVLPKDFNTSFLPSTRSVAFKKSVWKKVGGFSRKFDRAGEDTEFNLQLLRNDFRIVRQKRAIVNWEVPTNLKSSFKKFYFYSRGDSQSRNYFMSHNIHTYFIFFRYILFTLLFFLSLKHQNSVFFVIFCCYLFWSFLKTYKLNRNWKEGVWGTIIQISSDLAVMLGFLNGLFTTNY